MKVTVCFGPVSVVVPCGNGDILVRDLINQAVTRYRKASNKSNDFAVAVSALRSSDGAILDPDDRLADVVDDREQLAACLTGSSMDGTDNNRLGLNLRGDGTSASSNSGSPSPDFLRHHNNQYNSHQQQQQLQLARKDIEVTGQEADHLHSLQVRRGSEPALNCISPGPHSGGSAAHLLNEPNRDYKRWSAAPIVDPSASDSEEENSNAVVRRHQSGPRFSRSGARVSMQIFGGSNSNGTGYRWAEAADNVALSSAAGLGALPSVSVITPPDYEETMHRRTRSLRREPVGATSESSPLSDGHAHSIGVRSTPSPCPTTQLVILTNEGGPLGIHVVPDYSPLGNELGLLVQGVEPGGRIHRDGRIAVQDRITEINGQPLQDVPFHCAQDLFRNALQARDLRLRIIKAGSPILSSTCEESSQQPTTTATSTTSSSRVATVSPTRKPSSVPGTRTASALMTVSTRKIGKKLDLELIKGRDGLGFSVTTRDNPAGGLCPIYIKNILSKGAAIEDGRLRSGDRLLEVNGVEITGKSQSEVVALLRNIPAGGHARLLVSRQEAEEDSSTDRPHQPVQQQQQQQPLQSSPKLPRQMMSASRASEESLLQLPMRQREIITLDIPVHDTEKAGLGISVKGKTTAAVPPQAGTTDLGIFIKSVLHGGAASRDGRLRTNDQLLHVNGVSLLSRSNTEAMEGLRRAVHQEGPKPGHISLTIARKVPSFKDREAEGQSDDTNATIRLGGDNSGSFGDHSGGSSDQSGSTVIFVSGSGSASDSRERNLIKERLTGIGSDLRNESYYRATHETWNTTQLQESLMNSNRSNGTQSSAGPGRKQHSQNSPTVHLTPGEVVSIDGDYLPQSKPRPPPPIMTMTMMSNGSASDTASQHDGRSIASPSSTSSWHQQQQQGRQSQQRSGPTDGRDRPWMEQPQSPSDCSVRSDRPSDSEAPTYASQTSLEDPNAPGFSRDQFGRQSMSEKRHASLDAKSTDTYQRNKKLREERERQKQQETEQPPTAQSTKENVPPSGRVIRRAVKRRHAHPLVSRLEKDYLNSPPYHRSSPNLYQPDSGSVLSVARRGGNSAGGSRLSMAASQYSVGDSRLSVAPSMMMLSQHHRISSVESLPVYKKPSSPLPPPLPHARRPSYGGPRDNRPALFVRPIPTRDIGPTLGLKKSSSLESLQTVVQEIQMQEEEPQMGCYGYHRPTAIRVVRGRGCNESFRAAVDRSYDDGQNNPDGGSKEPMETLDEEAVMDVNEMLANHPPSRSPSSSDNLPGVINNKSETRKSKKKNANAAGLLLKGLGSMFRFGKHRKSAPSSPESESHQQHHSSGSTRDPVTGNTAVGMSIMASAAGPQHLHVQDRRSSTLNDGRGTIHGRPSEVDRHHVLRRTLPPDERDRAELGRQMAMAVARQAAQEEQRRIQHHYLRLMDQQQQQQRQTQQQQQHQEQQSNTTDSNRSQRLHQLRAQHQKRHSEHRQSIHTPTEHFESNREMSTGEVAHSRSASYDPYNDVRKPRSRAAVGEPNTLVPIAIPSNHNTGPSFNNNYDEFQIKNGNLNSVQIREMQELVRMQRLKVEGQVIRRQQHYHSQRSARETRMSPPGSGNPWVGTGTDRPVSNYFEYESLHIAGHTVALSGPPYKQQHQPPMQHPTGRRIQGVPVEDTGTTYLRRHERTDYGTPHGRASQRDSSYMPNSYGSSRQAPLAGSKV